MIEIWKPIEGYDNYMVSNLGRVKSLNYRRTGKEQLLKNKIDKDGYFYVCLCKDGKTKAYKTHRLVASAFIPNTENKPCVDHINTDITDNRVDNLRWCTQKENCNNPITRTKHTIACKEETKMKISKANKGKQARLGAVLSIEVKNKISQTLKKYYERVS